MKTPKVLIPASVRWAVWERDDFRCHYCGRRTHLSIDHIVPESRGGSLAPDNLVSACGSCNSMKGTADYTEFMEASQVGLELPRYREVVAGIRRLMAMTRPELEQMITERAEEKRFQPPSIYRCHDILRILDRFPSHVTINALLASGPIDVDDLFGPGVRS